MKNYITSFFNLFNIRKIKQENFASRLKPLTQNQIETIKLSAHKGYQPLGPENSILSFTAAGEKGFCYIETDVYMTCDKVLICMHDSSADRTTNSERLIGENIPITSLTYSDIKKLSFVNSAYGFDIKSADQSELYVPRFEEYLQICKKYGCKPFIEIKDTRDEAIKAIINISLKYFNKEDIVMSSGALWCLKKVYEIDNNIFCHLIWGEQDKYQKSIDTLANFKNSSGKVNAGIAFNIQDLTKKANYNRAKTWINKAKQKNLKTCLRAADNITELRCMYELGIDYYPTNTTQPKDLLKLTRT